MLIGAHFHDVASRAASGAASSAAPRLSATWFANLGKRLVKVAKICVRDNGLLHELLGVSDPAAPVRSLKSGSGWVGFALHLAAPMRIALEDFSLDALYVVRVVYRWRAARPAGGSGGGGTAGRAGGVRDLRNTAVGCGAPAIGIQ